MKEPRNFLTNTLVPAGRELGEAKNNPGDNTGTGVDNETYNDLVYTSLAVVQSYKEGGNSGADETLLASDMRDAIEEMVSKKVSGISDYSSSTNYTSHGSDLVMHKGFQFVNILDTTNTANDPLLNPDKWLKIPNPDKLMDYFYEGKPIDGGLNTMSDRAGAQYLQNFSYGRYRLGENGDDFYNFFRVNFDGTVITGDGDLEAIFDPGGTNEYFNLDLIAPDIVGTRTLVDMSSRHMTSQSSAGENDVLGAVLEDRFQDTGRIFKYNATSGTLQLNDTRYLGNQVSSGGFLASGGVDSQNTTIIGDHIDNGSGTPRTGLTTRTKEYTIGPSYIIVMIPV